MGELKRQFAGALLVILTVASVFAAALNFQQQKRFHLPEDGVVWRDMPYGVVAAIVTPGGPGDRAGIRKFDVVRSIQKTEIKRALEVPSILVNLPILLPAEYRVLRRGIEFKASLIVGEAPTPPARTFLFGVGVCYLLIGLLVYLRRSIAPMSRHFYVLCLASFIFYCFHFTGKLNNFDKTIYWGNVFANCIAPAVFLHFCLIFPSGREWLTERIQAFLYVPGLLLAATFVAAANGVLQVDIAIGDVQWALDRASMFYTCGMYLIGAAVLMVSFRRSADPVVRQQLRWLRNGALVGVLPFVLLYGLPYLLGMAPSDAMQLGVISLMIIPITWAYAIVRHRLFEVDIIFEQGYVYTLATVVVLGAFYGLFLLFNGRNEIRPTTNVTLMLIATFLFLPIRNWIQEQLERNFFYKDKYETRSTLITFARELSVVTDLDQMLNLLAERLQQTLSIKHLAFFLTDERDGRLFLKSRAGMESEADRLAPGEIDLSFLSAELDKPYLFFEHTRNLVDLVPRRWPGSVRRTISLLDLTYYLPCTVRGRTIAYIGLSRTVKNDFLSSDDMELLLTLTGYVGIAIENSRLYNSLQRKVEEFERLKEFSENIVESVNVGILAADLEDRVESWNSQMQRLTGVPREAAVGRLLHQLFPAELCSRFDEVRGQTGVHNIYKVNLRGPSTPQAESNGNGNGAGHYGRDLTVNLAVAPLISKDYEQIGRLIIIDDVTNQAQLERQLVQADKLSSIGLLAAGVAHEVNTPLAVISTYAQMLAKQVSGDDHKSVLLEKIAKQTFRASEIVNSLLNFSRTAPTEFTLIDLNRTLRETANLLQHQLENAGISVQMQLAGEVPAIRGNSGKLQQVFLNLLLNARDAMERGGKITLRSGTSAEQAYVEIEDNGSGISPENLARVYDPFFTTKGAKKGTGLGLAVTYGIVQEHGGTITVESQPGAGTRFRVEFPMANKPVHA